MKNEIKIIYYSELPYKVTREIAIKHPTTLFIFTDNTDRTSGKNPIIGKQNDYYERFHQVGTASKPIAEKIYYPNVTLAVLRGLSNAYPVTTQRYYHGQFKGVNGRWHDEDIVEFTKCILGDFAWIEHAIKSGMYNEVVMPETFLNTKISNLTYTRTPKLCEVLNGRLKLFFKFIGKYNGSAGSQR